MTLLFHDGVFAVVGVATSTIFFVLALAALLGMSVFDVNEIGWVWAVLSSMVGRFVRANLIEQYDSDSVFVRAYIEFCCCCAALLILFIACMCIYSYQQRRRAAMRQDCTINIWKCVDHIVLNNLSTVLALQRTRAYSDTAQ